MKKFIPLFAVMVLTQAVWAQNPFEQFGDKSKILTMTNGKFNEFHDLDSVVQIGSILLDVNKKIIVGYVLEIDTIDYLPDATIISRWWSVDPLAEKYYSISPYAFVANNPILFVDPDGREIWISYGDNQRVKYENGKLYNEDGSRYKGKDDFVSSAYKTLNSINSTKHGKTVVGELSGSENAFTFSNTYAKDSKGNDVKTSMSFAENSDGGGVIHAGALMDNMQEGEQVQSMAHELFHGYQHENGVGGASINNEVQAYLFGRSVAIQSGTMFDFGFGNMSYNGNIYNNAMLNLMTSKTFDQGEYNVAVFSFKTGSRSNQTGLYNRSPYKFRKDPLIKRFFPLTD